MLRSAYFPQLLKVTLGDSTNIFICINNSFDDQTSGFICYTAEGKAINLSGSMAAGEFTLSLYNTDGSISGTLIGNYTGLNLNGRLTSADGKTVKYFNATEC
mgnify:FL=1